ncbi:MAG: response regulator [Gammaproteobacteria bacterium]|nr:response regulator [Gammaproteobacteria bacterium]MCW8911074.1 response regulator [Gammaproteobacteria bacterium]
MNSMINLCDELDNTMTTSNLINILIVDDDKDILHAIRDILELEELPCQINIAETVGQALELAQLYPPDIAILDIKIGNENGLNLVPELKKTNSAVSCIMITAFRETEYAITAIRFGAHDFIYKPVEPVKIIKTIENLIANKTLEKERSKFERRFEAIFEQSQQWLFVLSPDGILINANQASLDAIESDTDSIQNKHLWQTPWWKSSIETQEFITSSIENIKPNSSFIKDIELNTNNIPNHFEITIKPILNSHNNIDQILVECRNITTQKTAEETIIKFNKKLENKVMEQTIELRQSISLLEREVMHRKDVEIELIKQKDTAESANRAKSEFLSRMSHELRTPMNAILGFGQLMELDLENPLTSDQSSNLKEIMRAGNDLLSMINDVLELSKLDKGDHELHIQPLSINDIINSSITTTLSLNENTTASIINSINNQIVLADSSAIKRITDNILNNSILYNKNNGDININSSITDYNYLRITFNDSGPGISDELRNNLFTPFDRLSTTMFETEGSGLGLAVSQNLMELMNGKIGVESTPEQGTTFWLEIPLSRT